MEVRELFYSSANVVEFRGYDLSREVWVKGFVSMANGLEYFDEDSTLGSIILTRIK